MLLSYSGERVLTQEAYIHTYFPLVRVHVAADVLLFRPRPGMRLGAGGRAGGRAGGWVDNCAWVVRGWWGGGEGGRRRRHTRRLCMWRSPTPQRPCCNAALTPRDPTAPAAAGAVGMVNKVGADFIGLLVLGFVNSAIAARSIRREFQPRLMVREE